MSEDVRAIRNLIDRWMKASKAGDTNAVLDMMTDDVIFMTCGRDPFGKDEFAVGGSLGVEIFKTQFASIELDGRAYGMFGSDAGAHLVLQPSVGANVAF